METFFHIFFFLRLVCVYIFQFCFHHLVFYILMGVERKAFCFTLVSFLLSCNFKHNSRDFYKEFWKRERFRYFFSFWFFKATITLNKDVKWAKNYSSSLKIMEGIWGRFRASLAMVEKAGFLSIPLTSLLFVETLICRQDFNGFFTKYGISFQDHFEVLILLYIGANNSS